MANENKYLNYSGFSYFWSKLKNILSGKQDTVSDLSDIRSNSSNGQTAYTWGNHANAGYVTLGTPITINGTTLTLLQWLQKLESITEEENSI